MSVIHRQRSGGHNTFLLGIILIASLVASTLFITPHSAHAAPGKINYQGRLADATGAAKPDGQYNIKFRIYSAASGGSLLWSEVRETTNRVTVTNGQFNVQLGGVTTIPDSVFASDATYFEVELPTPATATCSTVSCGTYTEGAMTPRQPIASSAYALKANDAGTLDGIDSSSFAQLGATNVYSGTNTYSGTTNFGGSTSVGFAGTSAFSVMDGSSLNLFNVDTANKIVSVGTGAGGASFGHTTLDTLIDTSDANTMNFSRYQTGVTAGVTQQISVYMSDSINAAPNNKFSMAIYSGTSTAPVTKIAVSTEGVLVPGWNNVPITATLSPSTYYWIGYNTNATTNANNLTYDFLGGTSFYLANTYANGYPTTIVGGTTGGTDQYMMNVEFVGPSAAITTTSAGKVGIGTTNPSVGFEVNGDVLFKDSMNSTRAFEVQNATSNSLLVADTVGNRIQIGSTTADATGVMLVLDTKNTALDPTGVVGAMYYNSNLGKFRCYQGSAWVNCITHNIVTLASDVTNNNGTANTVADVTGLSFSVTAGQTYHFSALINYTSAVATTGSRWAINGPATTTLSYTSAYALTATTQTVNYASAYNIPAAANASSLTVGNIATIDGIVTPSASGTIIVRFASEIASSAIVAKAGSTLTWW